jgi:hypothetical protein
MLGHRTGPLPCDGKGGPPALLARPSATDAGYFRTTPERLGRAHGAAFLRRSFGGGQTWHHYQLEAQPIFGRNDEGPAGLPPQISKRTLDPGLH